MRPTWLILSGGTIATSISPAVTSLLGVILGQCKEKNCGEAPGGRLGGSFRGLPRLRRYPMRKSNPGGAGLLSEAQDGQPETLSALEGVTRGVGAKEGGGAEYPGGGEGKEGSRVPIRRRGKARREGQGGHPRFIFPSAFPCFFLWSVFALLSLADTGSRRLGSPIITAGGRMLRRSAGRRYWHT